VDTIPCFRSGFVDQQHVHSNIHRNTSIFGVVWFLVIHFSAFYNSLSDLLID